MKKGPLSKKEKKFITEHQNDDIESVAKELNRSVPVIEKFHSTLESDMPKAGDLLARNERYGVVTMTESASMASDESKKKKKEPEQESISPRYHDSIHRFRE